MKLTEKTFKLPKLIARHFRGILNKEEDTELSDWLEEKTGNKILFDDLIDENKLQNRLSEFNDVNKDTIWAKTQLNLKPENKVASRANIKLRYRWIAAASVLLVFGGGLLFYRYMADSVRSSAGEIYAGTNTATLTLANGRKIKLSDAVNGAFAKEAGVTISKTADGQIVYELKEPSKTTNDIVAYNTLSTAKGQTYQIVLPDKSVVWLNAASSLKYPSSFAILKSRNVELSGEAYFEIAKDKQHPFIVKSRGQEIQVLGTHFNINSYLDEPATRTTLLEGSVKVNKNTVIEPGQQAIGSGNSILVKEVDPQAEVAWKNGDFIFNEDDDLKSAMRKIARWYDVQVIYETSVSAEMQPRGWISRKNTLSTVLQRIESTGKVHFKIEGRRVTVMQ